MTIAIAENYVQFNNWLRETGTDPKSVVFAAEPRQLYGLEATAIVYIGTWYKRRDRYELEAAAKTRVRLSARKAVNENLPSS